ncbi:MAG: hypothetical protein EBT13_10110, partial [Rhodobacteraceae bacterium]|nr:hypothetical protein [Paracoccaceae bacterium]
LAFADFYNGTMRNETKSIAAGRPIFDDVEMIRIRWAGNTKNEFHAPASDRSDRPVLDPETNTKWWPTWREHPDFRQAYEAFKLGNRIALMEGGRIVQCGTARDIISNPVNGYVSDFVAHMNPLGVLTARDVMEPGTGNGPTVGAETPVKDLIAQLAAAPDLQVIDNGAPVGRVTHASVLSRLGQ